MKIRFKKGTRLEARKAAKALISEYDITDYGGLLYIKSFVDAYSLELDATDQVEKDGISYQDRFGQPKSHPLLPTIRDSRAQKLAALKSLNLDLEPLRDRPGRPGG